MDALKNRYEESIEQATARGAGNNLKAFEKALDHSGAVVNCNLNFLKDFVTQSKGLYANYHRLVQAEIRKAASPEHDQERTVVDAIMFRSYASSINFAALSLNNRGLISYGQYCLRLREVAVASRSSILEENSFDFVERHHLGAKTLIPPGYRSDWRGRRYLAVAKLGHSLDAGVQKGGFTELLLKSNGNYASDQFMEVHVFGTFDFSAVECVSGPVPKKGSDRAIWEVVKEAVSKSGKRLEEW